MKLNCYPETDSLYIDLSEKPSIESEEITVGIVLDYGVEGNLAGIDIDRRQEDPTEGIDSGVDFRLMFTQWRHISSI